LGQIEWLLKYFRSLTGEAGETKANEAQQFTSQSNIEEDLKKGALKVMNKDDQFPGIDSSKGFNKKKKEKKKRKKIKKPQISLPLILP